jgi:hypothetical protein
MLFLFSLLSFLWRPNQGADLLSVGPGPSPSTVRCVIPLLWRLLPLLMGSPLCMNMRVVSRISRALEGMYGPALWDPLAPLWGA